MYIVLQEFTELISKNRSGQPNGVHHGVPSHGDKRGKERVEVLEQGTANVLPRR